MITFRGMELRLPMEGPLGWLALDDKNSLYITLIRTL